MWSTGKKDDIKLVLQEVGLPAALRSISRKIITCFALSSLRRKGYLSTKVLVLPLLITNPILRFKTTKKEAAAHLELRGHTYNVAHKNLPQRNTPTIREGSTAKDNSPRYRGTPTPSLFHTVPLILHLYTLASSSLSWPRQE